MSVETLTPNRSKNLSKGKLVVRLFIYLVILLVIRTALEDRTLQKELTGYKESTLKTRFRLIPGIW